MHIEFNTANLRVLVDGENNEVVIFEKTRGEKIRPSLVEAEVLWSMLDSVFAGRIEPRSPVGVRR